MEASCPLKRWQKNVYRCVDGKKIVCRLEIIELDKVSWGKHPMNGIQSVDKDILAVVSGTGLNRDMTEVVFEVIARTYALPPTTVTIRKMAFQMNNLTTSVRLNGYRKTPEDQCFQSSTAGKPALPASVCDISERALDCEYSQHANLRSAHVLKSIGDNAFAFSAPRRINLADSALESIGETAFAYSRLESFTAPPSLRTIGQEAFFDCSLLRHVDLSGMQRQGSISLSALAFSRSCLEDIRLPRTLRVIEKGTF